RAVAPAENGVARADQDLLRLPLQRFSTPREIAAWGAAQARAGNLSAARTAFEEAIRSEPTNQDFKEQLATVYTALGLRDEAAKLVEQVPNTDVAVYHALYEPPPGGFQKAIKRRRGVAEAARAGEECDAACVAGGGLRAAARIRAIEGGQRGGVAVDQKQGGTRNK